MYVQSQRLEIESSEATKTKVPKQDSNESCNLFLYQMSIDGKHENDNKIQQTSNVNQIVLNRSLIFGTMNLIYFNKIHDFLILYIKCRIYVGLLLVFI